MRIRIDSIESNDPEVYESLAALESELAASAGEEYTTLVLGKINAGETYFRIANGSDTEYYTIESDGP